MKKSLLACLLFLLCMQGWSQTESFFSQFDEENASHRHSWRQNLGQLAGPGGQSEASVRYYSSDCSPGVFLGNEVVSLVWSHIDTNPQTPDTTHRIDLRLLNSNFGADPIAMEPLPGIENFYLEHIPQGVTGVHSFSRVIYPSIYPSIDLHFYSNSNGLKLYFAVSPGGYEGDVQFTFDYADSVGLRTDGGLEIQSSLGHISFRRAQVFEILPNGSKHQLLNSGRFTQNAANEFGIIVEPRDRDLPLIIQVDQGIGIAFAPNSVTPEWGTFYGGNQDDQCNAVDTDDNGNLYLTGKTWTSNFPTFGPQVHTTFEGGTDAYIGRFGQNYDRIWVTLYGGSSYEHPRDVSYDPVHQRVFTCGQTQSGASNAMIMPFGNGSYAESFPIPYYSSGYIAAFDQAFGQLQWGTQFGGLGSYCSAIEADGLGNLFVAGATLETNVVNSNQPAQGPFPVYGPIGSYQQTVNNNTIGSLRSDGFVAKFGPQTDLQWSSFVGGDGDDAFYDLAIDEYLGMLYVVGGTRSTNHGLTGCPSQTTYMPLCDRGGFFQGTVNGTGGTFNSDGLITRFSLNGILDWSSYFGGYADDFLTGVSVNYAPPGFAQNLPPDVHFVGTTKSGHYGPNGIVPQNGDFPHYAFGTQYDQNYGGNGDIFVGKLGSQTDLKWCTYLGGSGEDNKLSNFRVGAKISTNEDGFTFVAGSTETGSTSSSVLPFQSNPAFYAQAAHGDHSGTSPQVDGYVYGFNTVDEIIYGSYFGGSGYEECNDISARSNRVYIGGVTQSIASFPLKDPGQSAYFDGYPIAGSAPDAFFAQIELGNLVGTESSRVNSRELMVHPNPAAEKIILDWDVTQVEESQLQILDQLGHVMSDEKFISNLGSNHRILDIGALASGYYLVMIKSPSSTVFSKFVKL